MSVKPGLAAVAALAAALAGCSAAAPEPTPTATGPETLATLTTGTCFDAIDGRLVDIAADVEVVACTAAHEYEVYATLVYPEPEPAATADADGEVDTYPGSEAIGAFAADSCREAFASFNGMSLDNSRLEVRWFGPSRATWAVGDRGVTCILHDPDGPLTGSAAGLAI